jgi:arginyl-tRNA synthetase
MLRTELKKILQEILPGEEIIIDYVPKGKKGDYATNIAFRIASRTQTDPYQTAKDIAAKIDHDMIENISIHKPAFINITINHRYILKELFKKTEQIDLGKGQKVLIEFVSANPTGPINIVSARAAAVGDSLIKLLNKTGYCAASEYYVNDSGQQARLLAQSIEQRIKEMDGGSLNIPDEGYHGAYLIPVAQAVKERGITGTDNIIKYALDHFISDHKTSLKKFGVEFSNWVRESTIHKKGYVQDILDKLEKKGLTYKKDGAVWLKTSDYGDKEDRVIIRSGPEKRPTYLLPDIAYHINKITRGYEKLINIWGPDHQAQIKSLQSSIQALGFPRTILQVLIVQQVNIRLSGKTIKMSKRAGSFKSLDDLLEKVPKDVIRFFLLMRSNSQHLDFDLDLALKESEENPVYYVQYAHARIRSILRKARAKGIEYSDTLGQKYVREKEEIILAKTILKYYDILEDSVRNLEPYMITYYLIELSRIFHYFYQQIRVISDDDKLTRARLALIQKVSETIKSGLEIIGVSCPESM